jgi:hypothetical protein
VSGAAEPVPLKVGEPMAVVEAAAVGEAASEREEVVCEAQEALSDAIGASAVAVDAVFDEGAVLSEEEVVAVAEAAAALEANLLDRGELPGLNGWFD